MGTKLSAFLTSGFLVSLHSSLTFAQQTQQTTGPRQPPWDWPGPWSMWGGGWGFWWICPLIMLLVIGVCAAIFLLRCRSSGVPSGRTRRMMDLPARAWGDSTYSALQVLNERFAKGEIQKQEYEEKKATILSNGRQ